MRKKRPLGQNFLNDPNIAAEIIHQANIPPEARVVEIGPGKGILTRELLKKAG
ncbi:MAG: ribosomal RNA small subunit methyltransferase A, partial [Nitrospinae bacterium]|nr:ribosomal RNA small subunit methyltransferase A [Nitrospinota bacterium]